MPPRELVLNDPIPEQIIQGNNNHLFIHSLINSHTDTIRLPSFTSRGPMNVVRAMAIPIIENSILLITQGSDLF